MQQSLHPHSRAVKQELVIVPHVLGHLMSHHTSVRLFYYNTLHYTLGEDLYKDIFSSSFKHGILNLLFELPSYLKFTGVLRPPHLICQGVLNMQVILLIAFSLGDLHPPANSLPIQTGRPLNMMQGTMRALNVFSGKFPNYKLPGGATCSAQVIFVFLTYYNKDMSNLSLQHGTLMQ